MAKFCTNCGATLDDDAVFCPECGARSDAAPADAAVNAAEPAAPAPEVRPEPQEHTGPQPGTVRPEQVQYTAPPAPAPVPAPAAEPEVRSKEISTAAYFWLMLLFAIPGIGLIALLIFAFAVKNRNLRHFARAFLIWILVAVVLLGLSIIVLKIAGISLEHLFKNMGSVIAPY